MEDILRVGVITTTHGLRGEVKVFPTTDDPQRFKNLKEVLLDTGRERRKMEIASCRFQKNLVILKFKGIDNINDVEQYKKCDLFVSRKNAVKLEENENFIADLIGLKVVLEDGTEFGTMKDVILTGANDVYVVETTEGDEVLLPAIRECILDVNLEEEVMTVHIMKGLLD
jgi:16S rRNA processing protein RimM